MSIIQDGVHARRLEDPKNYVRHLLVHPSGELISVELINDLQRLGVGYHFEKEIRTVLDTIWKGNDFEIGKALHTTALQFRIL